MRVRVSEKAVTGQGFPVLCIEKYANVVQSSGNYYFIGLNNGKQMYYASKVVMTTLYLIQ